MNAVQSGPFTPEMEQRIACVIVKVEQKFYIELTRDGDAIRGAATGDELVTELKRTMYSSPSLASTLLYRTQFSPRVLETTWRALLEEIGPEYRAASLSGMAYHMRGIEMPDEAGRRLFESAIEV